jgi:hypothetical protein
LNLRPADEQSLRRPASKWSIGRLTSQPIHPSWLIGEGGTVKRGVLMLVVVFFLAGSGIATASVLATAKDDV